MIVSKAVNMAQKMNVPVWGVVENMSYMRCPDCGKKMPVYADENGNDELKELGINKLGELPMTRTMLNMPKQGLDGVEDELKNALKDIVDKL